MAPTSDERREVARKMRDVTDTELYVMYLDEILCGILGDRWCRDGDFQTSNELILLRLADLIDPTCHVIPGKEAVAELKDGTRLTGVLLSCGHAVFGVSAKDMPRFCCECGARITNEVGDD